MIEKLEEKEIEYIRWQDGEKAKHYIFPSERELMYKLNEVIDHLNTQEEKAKKLEVNVKTLYEYFLEKEGVETIRPEPTASNQSNTEAKERLNMNNGRLAKKVSNGQDGYNYKIYVEGLVGDYVDLCEQCYFTEKDITALGFLPVKEE